MVQAIKQKLSPFFDNAMLYKDLTQWLRNKSFVALFILLLLVAESACVLIGSFNMKMEAEGAAGPIAFYTLAFVLVLYMFILAFQSYTLTAKEHTNRTFELYELSGMSLERMVMGKLSSMLAQFLFGFFCLVPFMFVAYMFGGLDFFSIIGLSLSLLLLSLPLYLFALIVALMTKFKTVSTAGQVVLVLVMINLVSGGVIALVGALFSLGGIGRDPFATAVKTLIAFNREAWLILGYFMIYYVQVVLLGFYMCCNAVRPAGDTRELAIRTIWLTLTLTWCGSMLVVAWEGYHSNPISAFYVMIYILSLVMGLAYFYNTFEPPVIASLRAKSSRWRLSRIYQRLFMPGVEGAARMVFAIWLLCLATGAGIYLINVYLGSRTSGGVPMVGRYIMGREFDAFLNILSYPLSLPFYLAWPALLVGGMRYCRKRVLNFRVTAIVLWVVPGVILLIALGILDSMPLMHQRYAHLLIWKDLAERACLISPLSTFAAGGIDRSPDVGYTYARLALGVLGLFMMIYSVRRRRAKVQAARSAHEAEVSARQQVATPGNSNGEGA